MDEVEFYIWVGKLVRKHRKSRNMSQDDLSVLQRTQFDGHKIDALLTISFTNAFGDEVTEVMRRIWLLFHMDEGTRAVLSHYLCVKPEYAQSDVLHCFRKTIIPHERATFTIPGFTYPKDKGFLKREASNIVLTLATEPFTDRRSTSISLTH